MAILVCMIWERRSKPRVIDKGSCLSRAAGQRYHFPGLGAQKGGPGDQGLG